MKIAKLFFLMALTAIFGCGGGGSSNSPTPCPSSVVASAVTQSTLASPYVATLTGCTITHYMVSATVGQTSNMLLAADTGSAILGAVSQSCGSECAGLSPAYVSSASAVTNFCEYISADYGTSTNSASWAGQLLNDTVSVASIPTVMDSFGALSQQSDFFRTIDCTYGDGGQNSQQGILGLGGSQLTDQYEYGFLVPSGAVAYLDALNAAQNFPEVFAFQMCMTGGNIWFGGYDSTYTSGSPTYTPITQAGQAASANTGSYFYVNLEDLQFGATDLGLTSLSFSPFAIVDTGTPITTLPFLVYDTLVDDIESNATFVTDFGASFFTSGNCVTSTLTESALDAALPSITLVLQATSGSGTVSVTLPASRSYLDAHYNSSGGIQYCPGIEPAPDNTTPTLIGASFMRSQIMIFDRNNMQVGFAPQQAQGTPKGCTY